MASIKIVAAIEFDVGDEKAANIIAEIIEHRKQADRGVLTIDDNYTVWDFDPTVRTISVEVGE